MPKLKCSVFDLIHAEPKFVQSPEGEGRGKGGRGGEGGETGSDLIKAPQVMTMGLGLDPVAVPLPLTVDQRLGMLLDVANGMVRRSTRTRARACVCCFGFTLTPCYLVHADPFSCTFTHTASCTST